MNMSRFSGLRVAWRVLRSFLSLFMAFKKWSDFLNDFWEKFGSENHYNNLLLRFNNKSISKYSLCMMILAYIWKLSQILGVKKCSLIELTHYCPVTTIGAILSKFGLKKRRDYGKKFIWEPRLWSVRWYIYIVWRQAISQNLTGNRLRELMG